MYSFYHFLDPLLTARWGIMVTLGHDQGDPLLVVPDRGDAKCAQPSNILAQFCQTCFFGPFFDTVLKDCEHMARFDHFLDPCSGTEVTPRHDPRWTKVVPHGVTKRSPKSAQTSDILDILQGSVKKGSKETCLLVSKSCLSEHLWRFCQS